MGTKKPRHKKAIRTTLTKEVADKLVEKVLNGDPLFTDEQYNTNAAVEIPIKDGVFSLKPATYRAWMRLRTKIPENGRVFYQVMREARHERTLRVHEEKKKMMLKEAHDHLRGLQKLPMGNKTTRTLQKSRYMPDGEGGVKKVPTHEEKETIETPVDPRMVTAKTKGAEIVVKALDPDFKKDDTATNVNVMVNLADLRKAKEERDQKPKEVPKADYEVKETKNDETNTTEQS